MAPKHAVVRVDGRLKEAGETFVEQNPWLGYSSLKALVDAALWQFMQMWGPYRQFMDIDPGPQECPKCGRPVFRVPFTYPGVMVMREMGHKAECPLEYATLDQREHG